MGGKHAPIELGKYIEIHDAAMRSLERDKHVEPGGDGLTLDHAARGYLMRGRIRCIGGILIDVTKLLEIQSGGGPTAMVCTSAYTYHVLLEGVGNVLRYCGPHDTPEHPDHNPFHHKHTYDVLRGDVSGTVSEIDPDDRPTLAEVIGEACHWYFENAEAIERLRARV